MDVQDVATSATANPHTAAGVHCTPQKEERITMFGQAFRCIGTAHLGRPAEINQSIKSFQKYLYQATA